MGGVDGYSLSPNAPKEAFEFLNFLVTTDEQKVYSKASTPSRSTRPRRRS